MQEQRYDGSLGDIKPFNEKENVPHYVYNCQWWYSLYTYNEGK